MSFENIALLYIAVGTAWSIRGVVLFVHFFKTRNHRDKIDDELNVKFNEMVDRWHSTPIPISVYALIFSVLFLVALCGVVLFWPGFVYKHLKKVNTQK
jgi:uncharacterized membrane protein HdeD (DUF308 family)